MVTKVNSGVFKDQVLAGSLRAFIIGGVADIAAMTATADAEAWTLRDGVDATYDLGDTVPDTLAELVYRVLSMRATIVSIEANDSGDALHVLMENASGWGYYSVDESNSAVPSTSTAEALEGLVAELEKLVGLPYSKAGATVGTVVTGFTAEETRLVFDSAEGALGALADGVTAKSVGGLGGNEHDQDTTSNDRSAP
jgi:cell wall-associated NlpC family hydrolase